jgi:peroxiredoxin Q/BCP
MQAMASSMLEPGATMPTFTLADGEGAEITSAELLGPGPLVLFFYPADDSPGCTLEACSFRDSHQDFAEAGARVVGISKDSVESHADFIAKRRLPYTLLSDPDNAVRRTFGVTPGLLGLLPGRVTFVVDATGVVRAVTAASFRPLKHVDDALQICRQLAGAAA